MALNPQQRQTVANLLATRANGTCQMCGETAWELDDRFLYVSDDPMQMGMYAMRVFPVMCSNCGQVVFFGAHAVGV